MTLETVSKLKKPTLTAKPQTTSVSLFGCFQELKLGMSSFKQCIIPLPKKEDIKHLDLFPYSLS